MENLFFLNLPSAGTADDTLPFDADQAVPEVAKVVDWVEQTGNEVGDGDKKGCDGISAPKGLPSKPKSSMASTQEPPKAPVKEQPMLPPSKIPKKHCKPEANGTEVAVATTDMLAEEAQT